LAGPLRKIHGLFYRSFASSFLSTNKSLETFLDDPRRETKKIRLKRITRVAAANGDPRAPLVFDEPFPQQPPHKVKNIRVLKMQQVATVIKSKTTDPLGTTKAPHLLFLFKNETRNTFLP